MKALLVFLLALVLGAEALYAQGDPRVRLLNRLGCPDCHTVAFLKIKGQVDVGPDLSAAYAEVPYRYGIPFERFFDQSPAMMRFVLGTRPPLSRAERDSLIALFRGLYFEQLARLDSVQRQVRPIRAGQDAMPKPRR